MNARSDPRPALAGRLEAQVGQHSRGPWFARIGAPGSHPDVWEVVTDDRGEHTFDVVAHVSVRRFGTLEKMGAEEIAANARVIAAAPDMLDALRGIVCASAMHPVHMERALGIARAAIRKAVQVLPNVSLSRQGGADEA